MPMEKLVGQKSQVAAWQPLDGALRSALSSAHDAGLLAELRRDDRRHIRVGAIDRGSQGLTHQEAIRRI